MCNLYSITKSQAAIIALARAVPDTANAEVGAIHPKAMPVILRTKAEIDAWMTAPIPDALTPQRQLPDGALRIVAAGAKEDGSVVVAR